VFGGLWIFVSDRLLFLLVDDPQVQYKIQNYKGWFFVLASAILIYFALSNALKRQREAEISLQESHERFQKIFETSLDAILLALPDGSILAANPAACKIFGRSEEEILRGGRNDLVDISDPRLASALEQRDREGYFSGELTCLRKDGTKFPVELSSVIYVDSLGQVRTNVHIRDISDRYKAKQVLLEYNAHLEKDMQARTQELRDAQETLLKQERQTTFGQLAGGVAHELRNPLGVIANAVYYLRLIVPQSEEKVLEYLGILERESQTAVQIISDLLNFSSVETGDRQSSNVADLIQAVLMKHPLPKRITLKLEPPKTIPPVFVDAHQIEQAIECLVVNACEAMEGAGILGINVDRSITQKKSFVTITIKDNGSGISPENQLKIFEPLFTTKTRRIGLGLALSRRLIEVNGGRIEVKSTVGKGTTFTLYLPVKLERKE
jgi:PAS domain S-box-containing protein